jgi:hypothetical protein
MLTDLGVQGTTTKNHWDDLSSAAYSAKYVSDTGGSGICINGDGLLTANKLVCEDPYCLDAYTWQPATVKLDEDFANQIAAEVAKKLSKQKDPLEKNSNVDEVEVPQMSGFIEI